MNREKFKEFVQEFKWLFDCDAVVIYEEDICTMIQDIADTINISYDMHTSWSTEFGCEQYFIQLKSTQDKSQFVELAWNLEYLLKTNVVIVKSYDDFNNICNVIGRLGIKHAREIETNFDNERIWIIGIDREWK